MFLSKDQLVNYLLQGHVHLSKKDYGFFHNLQVIIKNNKAITSNQTKLFDKLINKYQKQIRKNDLDPNILITLPWYTQVVESLPEYMEPKIYMDQDLICIKSPFNTKFVNKLRQEHLNFFTWDKTQKIYKSPYSTYSLKQALRLTKFCYDNLKVCDQIKELLDTAQKYEAKIYNPTLVKSNNNFYVLGMNASLAPLLQNINLSDDPKVLFQLSRYGIKIDDSVINEDPKLEFASNYRVVVNIEHLTAMVDWLVELGVEHVILSRDLVYNKKLNLEVRNLLDNKIECSASKDISTSDSKLIVNLGLSSNSPLREKEVSVAKLITISNTRPVSIS